MCPTLKIDNNLIGGVNINELELKEVKSDLENKVIEVSEDLEIETVATINFEKVSIHLEIKPNDAGILTFYVNGEPQGIIKNVKCNQIDGKYAYPIEFEIIHNKGHILILRHLSDNISLESYRGPIKHD